MSCKTLWLQCFYFSRESPWSQKRKRSQVTNVWVRASQGPATLRRETNIRDTL